MPRDFDPGEFSGRSQNVVTFDWPWLGGPLKARAGVGTGELFDERDRADVNEVRQGKRVVAMSFPQGRGRVTLLPGLRFLRNDNIGDLDDAELGWRLSVASARPSRSTCGCARPDSSTGSSAMHGPSFAAAALLLVLWLARIIPRFGPLEPDAPPPRRSLLEHLARERPFPVVARRRAPALLDAVRERAARTARRRGVSHAIHRRACARHRHRAPRRRTPSRNRHRRAAEARAGARTARRTPKKRREENDDERRTRPRRSLSAVRRGGAQGRGGPAGGDRPGGDGPPLRRPRAGRGRARPRQDAAGEGAGARPSAAASRASSSRPTSCRPT